MIKKLKIPAMIAVLVAVFGAGWLMRRPERAPAKPQAKTASATTKSQPAATMWTCAMHPQIRLPKPGKCPICGMTLIPLAQGGGEESERMLVMSPAAKALAAIETAPVERKFVAAEVRMVGKVDYDETRVDYITAWVAGRIDRLYVDYTGVPVKKGEHMVYLYSPELYAAQEELLQAIQAVKELKNSKLAIMRETGAATVDAARERLRLWGLTSEQVAAIEERGKPSDHMTIYAPSGGIVVHKSGFEGMYVKTGTRIYTIVDLTRVWVKLDAYESDLVWVRYGQQVEVVTEDYPGRRFVGSVAFIDPVLNAKTRTAKVRLNVDNSDGMLKPEMFVHAVVRPMLTEGGEVMAPRLAGKWMCPMHPEILKDETGTCDICGMPLVRTESLGFAPSSQGAKPPVVIPVTAPLVTGTRAVVYVEVPGRDKPTFEGREVVLGPRAKGYYIVRSGLEVGERVVTNGNFKIDSALQIQAKPSMMSIKGAPVSDRPSSEAKRLDAPEAFRAQLGAVLDAYLAVQKALAKDQSGDAAQAAKTLGQAVAAVDMSGLKGEAHLAWMRDLPPLKKSADALAAAKDLGAQRKAFSALSNSLSAILTVFGSASKTPIIQFRCPMAFDGRGAKWLQDSKDTQNPYLGQAMPTCGEKTGTFAPAGAKAARPSGEKSSATPKKFRTQLTAVLDAYLTAWRALAADDSKAATAAGKTLSAALAAVDMELLKGPAHMVWMKEQISLKKAAAQLVAAKDIIRQRQAFDQVSQLLPVAIKRLGHTSAKPIVQFRCAMAFGNRGATWLQDSEEVLNPYFGQAMPKCGEEVGVIEGQETTGME